VSSDPASKGAAAQFFGGLLLARAHARVRTSQRAGGCGQGLRRARLAVVWPHRLELANMADSIFG
jgi:hypothetical protein